MSTTNVQRTYGGRCHQTVSRKRSLPSDNASPVPLKRSRILTDNNQQRAAKPKQKPNVKQKNLIQLHFSISRTILRTCSSCSLSYTKGVPEDERLHSAHCTRVQRGMEWGREEERERIRANIMEIETGVRLKAGVRGRIVCFRADVGGRIGSKVTALLQTINLALSAPPLIPEVLHECKLYLFLAPNQTKSGTSREKIVGCLVAQHIKFAMATATPDQAENFQRHSSAIPPAGESEVTIAKAASLVTVDTGIGIFCYPEHLPTPMGISRLFVASTHRRQGIASKLLTAAAKTFIHGYELDPRKGEVAFTQPTGDGNAVMLKWGGGGVRIYDG